MSQDDAERRARSLLAEARTRADCRRLGAELDLDRDLREAVWRLGRARGASLPDEARDWPGKRLLRLALARQEEARRRTNPVQRDESFTCAQCGVEVGAGGRRPRDHCPHCLFSLHVDEVPGDRAATCGGLLEPVGVEQRNAAWWIAYRCVLCGARRVNRALLDLEPPDDWSMICALASRA